MRLFGELNQRGNIWTGCKERGDFPLLCTWQSESAPENHWRLSQSSHFSTAFEQRHKKNKKKIRKRKSFFLFLIFFLRPHTKWCCFKMCVAPAHSTAIVNALSHHSTSLSVTEQFYYSLVSIHPASLFQHPMLQAIHSHRNVFSSLLGRKLCKHSTNFIVIKKKVAVFRWLNNGKLPVSRISSWTNPAPPPSTHSSVVFVRDSVCYCETLSGRGERQRAGSGVGRPWKASRQWLPHLFCCWTCTSALRSSSQSAIFHRPLSTRAPLPFL